MIPDEAVEAAARKMCATDRQESIWAILDESERDSFRKDARAALEAAWDHLHPVVDNQAEADALPDFAVIRDDGGFILEHDPLGGWNVPGVEDAAPTYAIDFPARVLWNGDTE